MGLKFTEFREICKERWGVAPPSFGFLEPDGNPYTYLLLQPASTVTITAEGVEAETPPEKLWEFFDLAHRQKADLVCSPEYCIDWNGMLAAIDNGLFPDRGRMWVLGMQSIAPDELRNLQRRESPHLLFDAAALSERGAFLDPVCFLFEDGDGDATVVVQFKQCAMSAYADDTEGQFMLLGTETYVWSNDPDSIHLAAIICADALEFIYPNVA